jgi:hypothetical protein
MPNYSVPPTPTNLTPGQDWASIIASIFSGASSLGNKDANNANAVADVADPFRHQRPQYQQDMSNFMADPSKIFQDPAFLAAQQQGGEAVARNAGAAGMSNSGNKMADLFSFGQSNALKFENQKFNELSLLSGALTGSPAAAAQAIQTGQQNQAKGISSGIAGIAGLAAALVKAGLPKAVADQIAHAIGGGTNSGGPGGPAGGDIPAGTPDANGNISNGDGTFNSPSGQIVDANGQPIDPFGGSSNIPNITDPTTGDPMPIFGGDGPGAGINIPGVTDPSVADPGFWTNLWGG